MATNTNPQPTQAATAATPNLDGLAAPDNLVPIDSTKGYVRYQRRLKANRQWVTCYMPKGAGMPKATAAYLATVLGTTPANLPTYVAYNWATGAAAGFATWAPCYAYTNAMAHAALAPSVVASLGKAGLASVPAPCTQRAAATATAVVPTPAT